MSSEFSSVYLTGWEFNRLLGEDPIAPRLSCLPAATLWDGSALFWMFETVYCTSESLDGETYSARDLGWPSGQIFLDLENLGILKRVDWATDLLPTTHFMIRQRHAKLGSLIDDKILRTLIAEGDYRALEEIKLWLLEPALDHLGCFMTGAPSSLPAWFDSEYVDPATIMGGKERQRLMRASRTLRLGGLRLVPHPADAATPDELHAQSLIDKQIEASLIPDLLLGTGPNEGLDGYAAHVAALEPHLHAYKPVNDAMSASWESTRQELRMIRNIAKTHLWPKLHGEMLPRLQLEGGSYGEKFEKDLRAAVLQSPISSFLNSDSSVMFSFIASASALATTDAVIADYHEIPIAAAAAAATTAGFAAQRAMEEARLNIGNLRTFAQPIDRR